MPRLYRISSALAKRPASIQRNSATRPRAKLQKSHAALQEFVTAMLHSPGPPLRTNRTTSQAFAILFATGSPRGAAFLLLQDCPQFDSGSGKRFARQKLTPRQL